MVPFTYAFWCRVPSRPNFGDALTPWLIHRLTGQFPRFREPDSGLHKLALTGSVIEVIAPPCTVWGSGVMTLNQPIASELDVRAVRGPLTQRRLEGSGIPCPSVFGDPAWLLPLVYRPEPSRATVSVGLALHFSDWARMRGRFFLPTGVVCIDIQAPIEQVVDEICGCDLIVSSSLHGIIVAHAYGKPAVWVELRPLPSGDRSKFFDYFASIDIEPPGPVQLDLTTDWWKTVARSSIDPPSHFDTDGLLSSCPFWNMKRQIA